MIAALLKLIGDLAVCSVVAGDLSTGKKDTH